jgi:hypothetical protein
VAVTITDSEALDRLHVLLSGREWDADTINTVAYLVTRTGRVVADTAKVAHKHRITLLVEVEDAQSPHAADACFWAQRASEAISKAADMNPDNVTYYLAGEEHLIPVEYR